MSATAAVKPPTVVELIWEHELVLGGRSAEIAMKLDSAGVEGPSPMQALAFALAGCMAMDVVHILKKGRHDMRGLKADLRGERAPDDPRRFTSIELKYTVTGDVPSDAVDRAIQLSRDKYCSVWHSMRQDITFNVSYTIEPGM
jgi:putative redox protein